MSRPWGRALVLLCLLVGLWGLAFAGEIAAAVNTWSTSTAYNHCWLVLPVAAWLGWVRRGRLVGLVPQPTAWAALLAMGGAVAWLGAERLGIMEGRQLAAMGILITLVLAVFGWAVCRAMAAPLLYLMFLVPFGAFMVPALQGVTAWMIVAGLRLLEIPHFADALIIEIPAGVFLVAEACAGLRFIIASLAFGALYALVMFRSPGRRLLVMALALVVPVVANGLRALGTVLLGHHLGSAEAGAADHLIYGWVFFSVVILLLTLAGLPFRQDGIAFVPLPQRVVPGRGPGRGMVLPALLAALLGLAAPAGARVLSSQLPASERTALRLPPSDGCVPAADGTMRCDGHLLSGEMIVFPRQTTWSAVAALRQRLAGVDDEAATYTVRNWQGRHSSTNGVVLTATWLDGVPVGDGLRSRAVQGWNSLFGGMGRPVMAVLSLRPEQTGVADAAGDRRRRAMLSAMAEQLTAQISERAVAVSSR